MTFRRNTRIGLLAVSAFASISALLAGSACGDDMHACNDCPPLAGTWTLTFTGLDTLPPACEAMQVEFPSDPLELTQVGSGLNGKLGEMMLRGTVWDSWEFNLSGSQATAEGTDNVSVAGRYGPGAADGGESLAGTYTTNVLRGGEVCTLSRGFTALRDAE